jgi:Spy/CpxP family protein refolding chaperone
MLRLTACRPRSPGRSPPSDRPTARKLQLKNILFALTALAALGAAPTTFAADSVGAAELARTQANIAALQADKRQVMLDTLGLSPEQLGKFTPIYDEYQAEMKKLMTEASNLNNRLFVADYGGMTDDESKAIRKAAFKLRKDRLDLLEKYADKLDRHLPSTKVFQFVQIENKMQALLDVALAASIPIVTKTPNTLK